MEPDPQLPPDLQSGQCLRVIPGDFMCSPVAGHPKMMKQFPRFSRNHPLKFQPPDDLRLRFLRIPVHPGLSRHKLRQRLPKLTHLY